MENKFINRYHSYCKCLDNLKKSLTANPADAKMQECAGT